MNKYYIYLHIKLDTGEPFYIGKGSGRRAYRKTRRNEWWNNIVNKHNYDILIIEENLSEEESFERETYWIKRIGRRDLNLGPLINLTDGGEGPKNMSEEGRKKLSESIKGEKNPFYGKKHSENSKQKIREKRKLQIFSKETIQKLKNRRHSEETKRKMSESHKNRKNKIL